MLNEADAPGSPAPAGIPIVVRRHAEEVATRWWRRDSAYVDHPRTGFSTLAQYDETIDAHLDGLQLAGSLGLDMLEQALAVNAPDISADIFAALALAYLSEDEAVIADMLARTDALPGKAWALQGVFAWHDTARVKAALEAHLGDANPRYRDAALAQCHTHRLSGGDCLPAILNGSEPELLARALRTAGECGRVDLLPAVLGWLAKARQADPAIAYWAAWSATLLGGFNEDAFNALDWVVRQGNGNQRGALKLICLSLPPPRLPSYLETLSPLPGAPALAIQAMGWSGQATHAGWLIEQMRVPSLAVVAGEAFRLISGFDCEQNDAAQDPPPSGESIDAAAEAGYPYPDADRVAAWWRANQAHYRGDSRLDSRLLMGRPVASDWLAEILDQGEQEYRELAALHWALMRPGSILLPTRAHSAIQWLRLWQLKEGTS